MMGAGDGKMEKLEKTVNEIGVSCASRVATAILFWQNVS